MADREWKSGSKQSLVAGDVALIEVGCRANRHVGLFTGDAWRYSNDKWAANDPAIVTARPLVLIDPENREQVERFARTYLEAAVRRGGPEMDYYNLPETIAQTTDALREFANPKPPKPEEPTGHMAVVEAANGDRWVNWRDPRATRHHTRPWVNAGDSHEVRDYADIAVVRVLSEGVV